MYPMFLDCFQPNKLKYTSFSSFSSFSIPFAKNKHFSSSSSFSSPRGHPEISELRHKSILKETFLQFYCIQTKKTGVIFTASGCGNFYFTCIWYKERAILLGGGEGGGGERRGVTLPPKITAIWPLSYAWKLNFPLSQA